MEPRKYMKNKNEGTLKMLCGMKKLTKDAEK